MGALVERSLSTLFGGVSRQPASVRRENQAEDAVNALLSVVTGGFEKRPATQVISWLSFLDNTKTYATHSIDRDSTEQTFLLAADGEIQAVNSISGAQIAVTVADTEHYHVVEAAGIDSTGVLEISGVDFEERLAIDSSETAFAWAWELSDASTGRFRVEGSVDGITWNTISSSTIGGAASGTFNTTIGAVAAGDHNYIRVFITTGMASAANTLTLTATFKDLTYLRGANADDLQFVSVADNTFLTNRNIITRMAQAGSGTITSTVQTFSDLPTLSGSGNIHRVTGSDADGFGTFFVQDNASQNTWQEVADPNAHNKFDPSRMPHRLVRGSNGTFTFSGAAWANRQVGDEEITENPPFIGKAIQDVTFYRNRLTFVADEESYSGQSGNVLDMWPEKAVEVLDSDPVTRSATEDDINILKFATTFRKILFLTSRRAQFELTSEGAFTNKSASLDLATSYVASPVAKPAAMGDVLYFPSSTPSHGIIYEYFFDDSSLSNTAADITKHVVDYIPNDILEIVTDPTTGTVFTLTTGEQNSVFVYRTFFDGTEKIQSAWSKYTFGASESAAFIHGMAVLSGFLVMVIERQDGGIYLEQTPVSREAKNEIVGFIPLLDQREVLTGVYDSTNDVTVWTTTYEHTDDTQVILGPSFSEPGFEIVTRNWSDKYLMSLTTVLAGETFILNGLTFTAHATTTTTASREFSISGNDIADAGELATVINDSTDGAPGVTATDNGDATITLNVDDKFDGTITAPTGTAITNATLVAVEINDLTAVRGDFSANSVWIGRPYIMSFTMSQQFFRGEDNAANLTGRLQLRDMSFNVVDTGFLKITVTPTARLPYVYPFEGKILGSSTLLVGGASIATRATIKVPVWSNSAEVDITISNDQPVPCVVTSASWRGFFNEISRAE